MFKYTSVLLVLVLTTLVVDTFGAPDYVPSDNYNCRDDEIGTACGSACPENCSFKPEVCIALCEGGCFCKPGLIRSTGEKGAKCIPKAECPQKN